MPDTPASPPGLTDLEACHTRGDFGRLLTQLRGAARLSIRDVSAATGIPVATLGDYFNGRHLPPARDRILERIVAACGVMAALAVLCSTSRTLESAVNVRFCAFTCSCTCR